MTSRRLLASVAVYAALAALLLGFAVLRVKTVNRFAVQSAPDELPEYALTKTPPPENARPFFSLITNRTYGTGDRARVWVNYRGVESLDFRVYKVKDPAKFFRQLANPHQVGEDEEASVGESVKRKPTFLEKLRAFKNEIYGAVKRYVRSQLQKQARQSFNQKFRSEDEDEERNRTPLNVADYARVPLLNPDQMVSSWREKLPPLEDMYDRRRISLGRREPGVYLVEAVHDDLRAFGVVVVSDLALVQKTSRDGGVFAYAVDRKSGAPREGVRVEIVRGQEDVTGGATDAQGIVRLKRERRQKLPGETEEESEEGAEAEGAGEGEEESAPGSYLVLAKSGENFAISDLDSFYFDGAETEGGGDNLLSYVYTDRPVYRPQQRVYFKGILRGRTEQGYKLLPGGNVSVTVDDAGGGRVFEGEVSLSSRGTFAGELDLPEEAPLGTYNITATTADGGTASGYFEVQEYKKPEYKVSVTVPQQYVNAGERARYTVSARYFFGAPVARAEVKYYVYRSRYYG